MNIRRLVGVLNPVLKFFNVQVPPVVDFGGTVLIGGLALFVAPDLIGYFRQPHDLSESFSIQSDSNTGTWILNKTKTENGGLIESHFCPGGAGPMAIVSSSRFVEVEEAHRLALSPEQQASDDAIIVLHIYGPDRAVSVFERWDLARGQRLDRATIEGAESTCIEARQEFY